MTNQIEPNSSYAVPGKILQLIAEILRGERVVTPAGLAELSEILDEESKRIIGSLVWTEEDIPELDYLRDCDDDVDALVEKIGEAAAREKLNDVFYDFDSFDIAISQVNEALLDASVATLSRTEEPTTP